MRFLGIKTKDGTLTGNISFYCKMLNVSRQGFYQYLENKDKSWKYEEIAKLILEIRKEDEHTIAMEGLECIKR